MVYVIAAVGITFTAIGTWWTTKLGKTVVIYLLVPSIAIAITLFVFDMTLVSTELTWKSNYCQVKWYVDAGENGTALRILIRCITPVAWTATTMIACVLSA